MKTLGIKVGLDMRLCMSDYSGPGTLKTELTKIVSPPITNNGRPAERRHMEFFRDQLMGPMGIAVQAEVVDLVVIEDPLNYKTWGRVFLEMSGVLKAVCITLVIPYCSVPQPELKKYAADHIEATNGRLADAADKEWQFKAEDPEDIYAFWLSMAGQTLLQPKLFHGWRSNVLKKVAIARP